MWRDSTCFGFEMNVNLGRCFQLSAWADETESGVWVGRRRIQWVCEGLVDSHVYVIGVVLFRRLISKPCVGMSLCILILIHPHVQTALMIISVAVVRVAIRV